MWRLVAVAALMSFIALDAPAVAQMPITPGPGGIPIAPGSPVPGYTPGGIGPGGVEVAPGAAARDVPMVRIGPGGIPLPPRPDPYPDRDKPTARLDPGCSNDPACVPILPETLALTITSRDAAPGEAPADAPIDSIHDLFAALRTCWEPPARERAQAGMQMSVRFSFKRSGEIVAPPFLTYATPGSTAETRQVYRRAIDAALERCVPLRFSKTFSGAISGRPISIRYVDDRSMSAASPQP
jgi:hypothetical protein